MKKYTTQPNTQICSVQLSALCLDSLVRRWHLTWQTTEVGGSEQFAPNAKMPINIEREIIDNYSVKIFVVTKLADNSIKAPQCD